MDGETPISVDPLPGSLDAVTIVMPEFQPATAIPVSGQDDSTRPNWAIISAAMLSTRTIPAENIPTITAPPIMPPQTPDGDDGGCARCSLYFESVEVFYWPVASSNTDCLTQITSFSYPAVPSDASNLYSSLSPKLLRYFTDDISSEYPSAYVVFPAISAGNSCTQVGNKYTSVTMAFAPGELSTIEGPGGATKVFDFADLPCPPPEVAAADAYFYNPKVNPGRQYSPQIAPPPGIWELDPAFKNCVTAVFQGFDPPRAIPPFAEPNPSKMRHHGLPGIKRSAALAHQLPRAVTTTHGPG